MKKISLLTVALLAVLVICVGTASAQTASVGYKGLLGITGGEGGSLMSMNGLSFRGWVDQIGWEGTLLFGREKYDDTWTESDGDYGSSQEDTDIWALQLQVMYAIIEKENSKLYLGINGAYGRRNSEYSSAYWYDYNEGSWSTSSSEDDVDFWTAGPLVGAQYSFQGIPELSFNWEVGYIFYSESNDETYRSGSYSDLGTEDSDMDGIITSVGVHYAF